jgi:type I restriction enzyme S subunit
VKDVRLKFVVREIDERARTDGELPLLAVSIHRGVGRADPTATAGSADYKICRAGDIVLNRMRAFQGALGVAPETGLVSPDYAVLRAIPGFSSRFLAYLLRSSWGIDQMASRIRGIGGTDSGNVRTPRINVDDLGEICAPIPGIEEQRVIADFLDRECGRIADIKLARVAQMNAIAALEQSWLDEAMASAPTAGTIRLRDLLRSSPCYGVLVPRFSDEEHGVPFIRVTDLSGLPTRVLPTIAASQSVEYSRTVVSTGDVLVSVVGSVDRSAIVPDSLAGANIARAVARLQPAPGVSSFFLWACTRTSEYKEQALFFTSADTAQPTLNMGDLSSFRLIAPRTVAERVAIESRLRDGFEVSNRLAAETLRCQTALAEYRDALITEAVTGRLDAHRLSGAQLGESRDAVRLSERPEVHAS